MSSQYRWAILLCKCQDTPVNQQAKAFFDQLFARGSGSAISYWSDMSYGNLNISKSTVFDWVTWPITAEQAKGVRRSDAIANGITAHQNAGHNLAGYDNYLVFTDVPFIGQNVMEGGQQGPGSANGHVLVDQERMRPSFIFHEMGHGHGFQHSYDLQGKDYGDPFCVMSAESYGGTDARFIDNRFGPSGPSLASTYITSKGWLPPSNVIKIECDDKRPKKTSLILNPIHQDTIGRVQVGIINFKVPFQAAYFIDYHKSIGWDSGLAQDAIVIRQIRPDKRSLYVGQIPFSDDTIPAADTFRDAQFNLSVKLNRILAPDVVELIIAPAHDFSLWRIPGSYYPLPIFDGS
ncbi:hypothetical protein [Paenibacillus sp. OV219]|uniref:hypothetical protein n=1 Tax=Paenibacillus sp. OV219 TaxID=1884377 RepID=UPI0008AC7D7E|nr:hypothetical protein [Paenibacillus sp. OV219]SEN94455.1 hypothetical protein SAMN05518847_10522 [Paenibacillus sp. OV219]